jgi:hypothetical protein
MLYVLSLFLWFSSVSSSNPVFWYAPPVRSLFIAKTVESIMHSGGLTREIAGFEALTPHEDCDLV